MYNIDFNIIEREAREAHTCTHTDYGWCQACYNAREMAVLERVRVLALRMLEDGYIVQIGNTRQGCRYRTPEQMCQYLVGRGCDFELLTLEEAQAGMRRFLAFRQEVVMRGFTHVATLGGAVPIHEWTPYGLYGGVNDPLGIDGDDDFVWISDNAVMNRSVFANPPQPPFLAGGWKFLTFTEANTYLPMKGKSTDAIRAAVIQLGHLADPYYLKQLGCTQRQIEKAVRDGAIRWTRDGHLEAV